MSLTNATEPYPLCLERQLGATVCNDGAQFALWAPTASHVTLRLFAHGTDAEPDSGMLGEYPMHFEQDGAWTANVPGAKHGVYYDYLIEFADGSVTRSADPWARAAGANGRRSMVVDLRRTDPEGWEHDARPTTPMSRDVIWETHIGDFSNDPNSGVPVEHRGKYLAFTDGGTTLEGEGGFPTCVTYLKALGITVVQLLPFYDYGSVDETRAGGYNWGYDPVNYNVPEGSYATDPYDGEVRIRECKAMIQALQDAGISPEQIDYINAHGTSTHLNDLTETMAIKTALGEKAYDANISSTKSMTGHLLGATGAVEAIASVMALNDGVIPPTINLDEPDEGLDLNYTPNKAVKRDVNVAASTNLGFGGHDACLVFKKY